MSSPPRPKQPLDPPMTLGKMRAVGAPSLVAAAAALLLVLSSRPVFATSGNEFNQLCKEARPNARGPRCGSLRSTSRLLALAALLTRLVLAASLLTWLVLAAALLLAAL